MTHTPLNRNWSRSSLRNLITLSATSYDSLLGYEPITGTRALSINNRCTQRHDSQGRPRTLTRLQRLNIESIGTIDVKTVMRMPSKYACRGGVYQKK